MLYEILTQLAQFLSTVLYLLAARYLLELSSIKEDLFYLERFLYESFRRWRSGTFEHLIIWYRVRKLLDYD